MSGVNYLKNLRRGDLNEIATDTNLPNASSYKTKEDLAPALDEHLKANSSAYASSANKLIGTYYSKANSKSRSPVKALPDAIKSDDDQTQTAVAKQRRRKTTNAPPADENSASGDNADKAPASSTAVVRTADRRSSTILQQTQEAVGGVSPTRVVEVFESQVSTVRSHVTDVFDKLHLADYAEAFRRAASTPLAIALLAGVYEASSLTRTLVPLKHLHDLELGSSSSGVLKIFVPDLFVLLEYTNFWEPALVWLLSSLVLPLFASYVINIPWKVHESTHSHSNSFAKRSSSHSSRAHGQEYDLFVFFIAKALLSYLVYAEHFQYFGLFTRVSTVIVNDSFYDNYRNLLTTSGVGAALTLYEAVLLK